MTNWTTEALGRHRARMGWPPLDKDASDQVVAILNDALGKFAGVGPLPGVEPTTVFVASHRSAAKQEAGS
jgi:hypothetical protein